jgi:hypothetical protein
MIKTTRHRNRQAVFNEFFLSNILSCRHLPAFFLPMLEPIYYCRVDVRALQKLVIELVGFMKFLCSDRALTLYTRLGRLRDRSDEKSSI